MCEGESSRFWAKPSFKSLTMEFHYTKSNGNGLHEALLARNSNVEEDREEENVTPYNTASILSLATISWMTPLLALGYRKHLDIKDIPLLAPQDRARKVYQKFKQHWDKLKDENRQGRNGNVVPSIAIALAQSLWRPVCLVAMFEVVNTFTLYVGPYLIGDFVEFLHKGLATEGYILVFFFFAANVFGTLSQRQWWLGTYRLNLRVRACLTAIVFNKGMCLSSEARKRHASGEIINYMAVDVARIADFSFWVHDFWVLPLQVGLALGILYKVVGIFASVAALATTIVTILLNVPLVRLQKKFQEKIMAAKDLRMKTTSEALRSMRILKLQAWEIKYLTKIEQLRESEYGWLAKDLYMVASSTFLLWTAPTIVSIATFGTCLTLGVPLTAGRVLSAVATIRVLRDPLRNFPDLTAMMAQTKVSLHRLHQFLQEPELPPDAVDRGKAGPEENSTIAIEVEGEFSWETSTNEDLSPPTLCGVNLQVPKGQHVAVCGSVGSGKSSLLACMLGEIPKVKGKVRVEGSTAYVAQTAWIQSGTIKDNICFGSPMNSELYEKVLQACDLKKDIAIFPFGDNTEIGERGVNLSGGQKQRVQLARALYQDSDVYFLDDPFSAVDAQTGSHLLRECIMGALQFKTVVYVTHQMEFLPSADLILVLRGGEIVQAGKYHDLLQAGTDFSTLVSAHIEAIDTMHINMDMNKNENKKADFLRQAYDFNGSNHSNDEDIEEVSIKNPDVEVQDDKECLLQLVKKEEREKGRLSYDIYWAYITAVAGGAFVPIFILAQITFQVLQILSNYWMAWGTPAVEGQAAKVSSKVLITVYCLLAVSSTAFVMLRAIVVSIVGLRTAQKYFLKMLRAVFRAPMSFFDSTPTGRILNRMSADQSTMDLEVQFAMSRVVNGFLQLLGILALMAQIKWQILLLVFPIAGACLLFQRYCMASARELARLYSIQKSPIINHYSESISGAATIRGFQQEERFMDTNLDHFNRYAMTYFHSTAAREWLMFHMEVLSVFAFTLCLVVIATLPRGSIDPSLAGLAIMYGLNLNGNLSKLVWNLSSLETTAICVERIRQYCTLKTEAALIINNSRPSKDWPSEGNIAIHNLQVRYNAHSPTVLLGVSCNIRSGQRVGIVGRTGSGKSTFIQALFRMVEPVRGSIIIDEVDISTIGLHDLRSRLSIIPQEPTLFEGNIRVNLDPLQQHSDVEIWEALDKSQLGDIVRAKEEKLDSPVSENGENWSVGQRQLLCLGRALLKKGRILVLDEATASVDSATDGLIQHTLRTEFKCCTVITVAHRIPTVIDSDDLVVLHDGKIVEHNKPRTLLENKSSFFSKLVEEYSTRSTNCVSDCEVDQPGVIVT